MFFVCAMICVWRFLAMCCVTVLCDLMCCDMLYHCCVMVCYITVVICCIPVICCDVLSLCSLPGISLPGI